MCNGSAHGCFDITSEWWATVQIAPPEPAQADFGFAPFTGQTVVITEVALAAVTLFAANDNPLLLETA